MFISTKKEIIHYLMTIIRVVGVIVQAEVTQVTQFDVFNRVVPRTKIINILAYDNNYTVLFNTYSNSWFLF
jgi:hypothetical protein